MTMEVSQSFEIIRKKLKERGEEYSNEVRRKISDLTETILKDLQKT